MAGDDGLLADKVKRSYRSPSDILAAARGGTVAPPPEPAADDGITAGKKADPLPLPGEPYRASARFMERLQSEHRLLHFVLRNWTVESFAYHDLRRVRMVPGDRPGEGPSLLLRFVEAEVTDVEIQGRHLRDIHYYLSLGVMPWVWEYPGAEFEEEHAPVITRIVITSKVM